MRMGSRSRRHLPNADGQVLELYMSVPLNGNVGIDDGRVSSINGFTRCCLCGDRIIRKMQLNGVETAVNCASCGGLQCRNCVSRWRTGTFCGVTGAALVHCPGMPGLRINAENVFVSGSARAPPLMGQVAVDQFRNHTPRVPKRPGGHLILKSVEAQLPKVDPTAPIDISQERGLPVYSIAKVSVCNCIGRSTKRRRQFDKSHECELCNKPIPLGDEVGQTCGYCGQHPADHVHATCENRTAYTALFKEKTYIYMKSESFCRWCNVKSPDHLQENCRHKKYVAHQEALSGPDFRDPCVFCNERNPKHSPLKCNNAKLFLAFKSDYLWHALTQAGRDWLNSRPAHRNSRDGLLHMSAFAMLLDHVIIQDQFGAMMGNGAHNKQVVAATWKYGTSLNDRSVFTPYSRSEFRIHYYDDMKYADVDCVGNPEVSMLINPEIPEEYNQLLLDRPEVNNYPTEVQDEDKTPRNLSNANAKDVEIPFRGAAPFQLKSVEPIARLGEAPAISKEAPRVSEDDPTSPAATEEVESIPDHMADDTSVAMPDRDIAEQPAEAMEDEVVGETEEVPKDGEPSQAAATQGDVLTTPNPVPVGDVTERVTTTPDNGTPLDVVTENMSGGEEVSASAQHSFWNSRESHGSADCAYHIFVFC